MGMIGKNRRMAVLFLLAFRFVRLLLSGHQGVALENAALRMQIAAFQRKRKRPLLTAFRRFYGTTKSLAESIRRATHRLNSKGVSEPLRHPERISSQEDVVFLLPLLPRIENAPEPVQAMPVSSRGTNGRKDCRHSTTRGPPSSI